MELIGIHVSDCGDLPAFLVENHREATPEIPFISTWISENIPAICDSYFIAEVLDLFYMEFPHARIGCGATQHSVNRFADAISPFSVGDKLVHVLGEDFFEQNGVPCLPGSGILLDQGVNLQRLLFFSGFDLGESKGGNQEENPEKGFHELTGINHF